MTTRMKHLLSIEQLSRDRNRRDLATHSRVEIESGQNFGATTGRTNLGPDFFQSRPPGRGFRSKSEFASSAAKRFISTRLMPSLVAANSSRTPRAFLPE